MDAEDQPIFEPELNTTPLWSHTHLLALFEGGTEAELVLSHLELLTGFHDVGVLGTAVGEGVDPLRHAVRVDVSDQVQAQLGNHLVAKAVHLLEFPLGVDMHHRKRQYFVPGTDNSCRATSTAIRHVKSVSRDRLRSY